MNKIKLSQIPFKPLVILLLGFLLSSSIISLISEVYTRDGRVLASSLLVDKHNTSGSRFTSPSTPNGVRRFLAIGNFYDYTNGAYFANSEAYIDFNYEYFANNLIEKVELSVFKYANSLGNPVQVNLVIDGDIYSSAVADPINNQFQELIFAVPKEHFSTSGLKSYKLVGDSGAQNAGIAVCSGNWSDSLCEEKYFPKVHVYYRSNTLGILTNTRLDNEVYNATFIDEYVQCEKSLGCNFRIDYTYNDLENNSLLTLYVTDRNGVEQKRMDITNGKSMSTSVNFHLEDGQYYINLRIIDGAYVDDYGLGGFTVATKPPNQPEVIWHSEYSSNSGSVWRFKAFPDDYVLQVNSNAGDETREKILKEGYAQIKLNSDTPHFLESNKYTFSFLDRFLNQSDDTIYTLAHIPKILEVGINLVDSNKISPKNSDGLFDLPIIELASSEVIKDGGIHLLDNKYQSIYEFKQNEADSLDWKKWADGVYWLKFTGEDLYGYPALSLEPVKFEIDNTPPNLNSFRVI